PKLAELALRAAPKLLADGVAPGAGLVLFSWEFVRDFIDQHAKDSATQALSKAIPETEDGTLPYDKIADDIKNWESTAAGQPFKNMVVQPDDVKNFLITVRDLTGGNGDYDLTQLVGWLNPEPTQLAEPGEHGDRAWQFELGGEVKYEGARYRDG